MTNKKEKALEVLKKYWGYDSFRDIQEDVVLSVLSGRDTMALARTGLGKTVMFQVPAMLLEGTTIVVSPLKALQKDQVDNCIKIGLPVAFINSDVGIRARRKILKQLEDNELKLLYVAPETFFSDDFEPFRKVLKVPLIAIDESHCASSWSDFRPTYQRIHEMRKMFPSAVMLAVTATADEMIKKDIVKYTGLKPDYKLLTTSFDRVNIFYNVFKATKPVSDHVLEILMKYDKKTQGIIYCGTRDTAEQMSQYLNMIGYPTLCYHAGMKKKEKEKAQEDYSNGVIKIVCATVAFGMGIDIPCVRYVIHVDPPHTFDDYSQQTGRCSRDGERADAYLIYLPETLRKATWLISQTTKNTDRLHIKLMKLKQFHAFCKSNTCLRTQLLGYFNEKYPKSNCGSCNICLSKLTR